MNMSFIQENIINVTIGVSKEYQLIQFSDVHVATYIPSDSTETNEKAITQEKTWVKQRVDFARKFNEFMNKEHMIPSVECLCKLIEYSNENHPDLVLLTGDIVDYYSEANYDYLKQSLSRINSPYLFSCGNHESPSSMFLEMFQELNYVDFNEFIVISIDNSQRIIKESQVEKLEKLLALGKPIILALHVPIMTEYNETYFMKLDPYYSMKYNDCDDTTKRFIHLVQSSDEIKAIFCGHTHGAITSIISPNKPQYCCSSGLIGSVNKIIIK